MTKNQDEVSKVAEDIGEKAPTIAEGIAEVSPVAEDIGEDIQNSLIRYNTLKTMVDTTNTSSEDNPGGLASEAGLARAESSLAALTLVSNSFGNFLTEDSKKTLLSQVDALSEYLIYHTSTDPTKEDPEKILKMNSARRNIHKNIKKPGKLPKELTDIGADIDTKHLQKITKETYDKFLDILKSHNALLSAKAKQVEYEGKPKGNLNLSDRYTSRVNKNFSDQEQLYKNRYTNINQRGQEGKLSPDRIVFSYQNSNLLKLENTVENLNDFLSQESRTSLIELATKSYEQIIKLSPGDYHAAILNRQEALMEKLSAPQSAPDYIKDEKDLIKAKAEKVAGEIKTNIEKNLLYNAKNQYKVSDFAEDIGKVSTIAKDIGKDIQSSITTYHKALDYLDSKLKPEEEKDKTGGLASEADLAPAEGALVSLGLISDKFGHFLTKDLKETLLSQVDKLSEYLIYHTSTDPAKEDPEKILKINSLRRNIYKNINKPGELTKSFPNAESLPDKDKEYLKEITKAAYGKFSGILKTHNDLLFEKASLVQHEGNPKNFNLINRYTSRVNKNFSDQEKIYANQIKGIKQLKQKGKLRPHEFISNYQNTNLLRLENTVENLNDFLSQKSRTSLIELARKSYEQILLLSHEKHHAAISKRQEVLMEKLSAPQSAPDYIANDRGFQDKAEKIFSEIKTNMESHLSYDFVDAKGFRDDLSSELKNERIVFSDKDFRRILGHVLDSQNIRIKDSHKNGIITTLVQGIKKEQSFFSKIRHFLGDPTTSISDNKIKRIVTDIRDSIISAQGLKSQQSSFANKQQKLDQEKRKSGTPDKQQSISESTPPGNSKLTHVEKLNQERQSETGKQRNR